jgi:hypothetical protein
VPHNDESRIACELYDQVKTGAPPGTRTPNLRIKSPLLCSFILLELLSNNASTCQDLPFCPTARIRAVL